MLVLTRKQKECIKIGDSITITIVRVQGQAVRVGIEAPREVRVVRGELTASKPASTDTATDNAAATDTVLDNPAPVDETAAEPQVIEFRFSPSETRMKGADSQPRPARGPLASIMATLGTPGFISAAAAK